MPLAGIGLLTVSIGIATMPDHATDADSLVRAADGALYLAKERGRNRAEVAPRSESHTTYFPTTRASARPSRVSR